MLKRHLRGYVLLALVLGAPGMALGHDRLAGTLAGARPDATLQIADAAPPGVESSQDKDFRWIDPEDADDLGQIIKQQKKVAERLKTLAQKTYTRTREALRSGHADWPQLTKDLKDLQDLQAASAGHAEPGLDVATLIETARIVQAAVEYRDQGKWAAADTERRKLPQDLQDAWTMREGIMCPGALDAMRRRKSAAGTQGATVDQYRERYRVLDAENFAFCRKADLDFDRFLREDLEGPFAVLADRLTESFQRGDCQSAIDLIDAWSDLPFGDPQRGIMQRRRALLVALKSGDLASLKLYSDEDPGAFPNEHETIPVILGQREREQSRGRLDRHKAAELTLVSTLDGKEVPADLAPLRESVAVIEGEQRQGYESALTLLALYPACNDSAALSATDPCLAFLKSEAWQGKPYGALIGALRTRVSQQVRQRVQEKYAELEQQLRDRQTDVAGLTNDVETLRGYDVIAKDKLEQLKTRAQALQETLALRDRGDLAGAEARRRTLDRAIQDAWGLRIDIMCPAALQQMQALKSEPSAGGAAIDDYRKRYAVLSGNDFRDCQWGSREFREFVTEDQNEQFQRFREAVHEQFAKHDLDVEMRLLDSWVDLPATSEQRNFISHQIGLARALKNGDRRSVKQYLAVIDAALVFPDAQEVAASYLAVETLTEGCPAISLPDTETAYRNRYLASADAKERACIHLEWGNSHFDDQVGGNCESFIAAVREAQTAGSRIVEAQSLERSGNCRERQDRRDQAIEYFKAAAKADPDRRTRMEGEIRRLNSSIRIPEGPASGSPGADKSSIDPN